MKLSLRLRLLFLLAFFPAWSASVCQAHLPGENSIVITSDSENVIVIATLSLSSVTALVRVDGEATLSAATLEKYRDALVGVAPRISELMDESGALVRAERVFVSLPDGQEIRFRIFYRAGARLAQLRTPFLTSLSRAAFCEVSDHRQKTPNHARLSSAAPELALTSILP